MASLSPNHHAAIAQVSARLSALVTTSIITGFAAQVGLAPLGGSNKADKLRELLTTLWCDGRRRDQAGTIIGTLLMEAHARSVQGKVDLYQEDVEEVLAGAKQLGFSAGQFRGTWHATLKRRTPPTSAPSSPKSSYTPAPGPRPKDYVPAIDHIRDLSLPHTNAQYRGKQLELIVFGILKEERLSPERNIYNPGEEIDISFVLEGQHYVAESKWEKDPCGYPVLRSFFGKVDTKATGTFGVVLSMSGYVDDINEKAQRGRQLSSIGLGPLHLMNILEGRTTWAETVRRARMHASRRSIFYTGEL